MNFFIYFGAYGMDSMSVSIKRQVNLNFQETKISSFAVPSHLEPEYLEVSNQIQRIGDVNQFAVNPI